MKNSPFKDELIVRYLLGDLSEEEQCGIEDLAFQDRQYLQQILTVESDLIDEYVRGELSDSSRRKFEGRFLASTERQKKVAFARALAGVLPEAAVIEKKNLATASLPVSLWDSLRALLRKLSPTASFSLAAATLLIALGGIWLISETLRLRAHIAQLQAEQQSQQRNQQTVEGQLADERTRSENLSSRLEGEQQQREHNEELIRELERQREEATSKPALPSVLSLTLLPGIARGGNTPAKLILPQSARLVRLRLSIEPGDDYKHFLVELRTQAKPVVWSQNNLSARTTRAGQVITLHLPAKLLDTAPYELALKGVTVEGKTEAVAYYNFDVQKK